MPEDVTSIVSNVVTQLQLVLNLSHWSLFLRASVFTMVIIGYLTLDSHYAGRNFIFSLCKNYFTTSIFLIYQIFKLLCQQNARYGRKNVSFY